MSDADDFFSDLTPVSKRKTQEQPAEEATEAKVEAPSTGNDTPPSSSRPASAAAAVMTSPEKEVEAPPPRVVSKAAADKPATETKPPGPPMGSRRRPAIPSSLVGAPSDAAASPEEVEALLRKFAGGLQRVLEGING